MDVKFGQGSVMWNQARREGTSGALADANDRTEWEYLMNLQLIAQTSRRTRIGTMNTMKKDRE